VKFYQSTSNLPVMAKRRSCKTVLFVSAHSGDEHLSYALVQCISPRPIRTVLSLQCRW